MSLYISLLSNWVSGKDTVPTIMSVQHSIFSMWSTSRTDQLSALNLCFFWYKYNLEKEGKRSEQQVSMNNFHVTQCSHNGCTQE